MSKIVEENIGIVSGMTALYCAVSDEASMTDMVTVQGWHPVSNDPTVKTVTRVLSSSIREPAWNIQNKDHWCYAVTAIILADKQYSNVAKDKIDDYLKRDVSQWTYYDTADGDGYEPSVLYPTSNGVRSRVNSIPSIKVAGYDWQKAKYFCDPVQECVANYLSYDKDDKNVVRQLNGNGKILDNNHDGNSYYTLKHLTSREITVIDNFEDEGAWFDSENNLLDEVKGHLVDPLNRGEKVIVDAFVQYGSGKSAAWAGHSYVAVAYDLSMTIVALFDPWTGEDYSSDTVDRVKFTLNQIFKVGFHTPVFDNSVKVKVRRLIHLLPEVAADTNHSNNEKNKKPVDASRKLH